MMKYRKRPIVIEATQWDGTYQDKVRIEKLFIDLVSTSQSYHEKNNTVSLWAISTLEGSFQVSPKDYLIKGVKGEFYPCKPDIFEMTYEEVED